MSLGDKIAEKIAGALGWLLLKELRRIASAIEQGIDSDRELAGFQPIFSKPISELDAQILSEQTDAASGAEGDGEIQAGGSNEGADYMRLDILEALAAEQNIQITPNTDLIALGKDRGWLDASGGLVMLPKTGVYSENPHGSYGS